MRIEFQQPIFPANPSIWHHMSDALLQSVYRVSTLLISILPGVLAFVLALGLMAALGILLSWILRRALTAAKFDDRMARAQDGVKTSVAEWSPDHSPTALIGRIAFWGCIVLGLVIGILSLDVAYAADSAISLSLLPYVTRSVGAILLLVAGNLLARFLARSVLIGAVNNQLQYARFLSLGVKWLMLVLTAAMVLDHLQIGGNIVELAFGILFGGIVLTLALAVGLGSRDLVTRSLERSTDRSTDRNTDRNTERSTDRTNPTSPTVDAPRPTPIDTLRHF